ncbi:MULTISPECIES: flagellar hook protein FlgE, partial [Pseudomonas]
MSFNIGLSGLNAASKNLNVTGNNIANVGSTGFKASRAEFADVYATSMFGSGKNTTGSGVLTANVSQQFTQGNITSTGGSLDLAINGNGFFVLSDNGSRVYTRNGTFHSDSAGFVIDNSGNRLQGYGVDASGNIVNGVITDLKIDTTNQLPKATTDIDQVVALNSTAAVPTTTPFNPSVSASYNWSTSVDVYDSQGNSHTMSQYFVKSDANNWTMYVTVDGRNPSNPGGDSAAVGAAQTAANAAGSTPASVVAA